MMCKMSESRRWTVKWSARRRWARWCETNERLDSSERDRGSDRRRDGVEIGPFAIVGENCTIGPDP